VGGEARVDLLPTMEAMKKAAKKQTEDTMQGQVPGILKPCVPCRGGSVGTLEKFVFWVPADQQQTVRDATDRYENS